MTKKVSEAKSVKDDRQKDLSSELTKKLKMCELEVQNYVAELKAENLKLHRQIAKYQAQEVSLNNRIKALIENKSEEFNMSIQNLIAKVHPPERHEPDGGSGTKK